jgi:succinate dehydrogenase / fumarate reductase, cytochrome b subunit
VASPVAASQARIPAGVPPLRAGEGSPFLLRRLHSLTGIVGTFLVEHFISKCNLCVG